MSVIYFDTNVLLGLYRYPKDKAEKLLDVLTREFNIIIPERVCFEFDKNKKKYILSENKITIANELEKEVEEIIKKIYVNIESLEKKKRFKRFDTKYFDVVKNIKDSFNKEINLLNDEIEKCKKEYEDNEFSKTDDAVSRFVDSHSSNVVTTIKTKLELLSLFDSRVKSNIPPGKSDSDKIDKNDPYARAGDYLIWNEILNKSIDCEEDIIFVTNETKNDYWEDYSNFKFNKFLLEEFEEYSNKRINFIPLNFDKFLEEFVFQYIEEDIDLLGFLQERRNVYQSILTKKDYLKSIENEIELYIDDRILDDYLCTSINGGNIEEFCDVELQGVNFECDLNDIDVQILYTDNLIEATIPLELKLLAYARVYFGRDIDKEYIYIDYPVKILLNAEVTATYNFLDDEYFDDNDIALDEIINIECTGFDIETEPNSYDDYCDYDDDDSEYCVECPCLIIDDDSNDGSK